MSEEEDVQVEIQKTLASINEVTIKIKKELMMIIDLIRDEGRLGTAVKDANESLASVLQELGIDITSDANAEGNEDILQNLLMTADPDFIAKSLLSIEGTQAQSQ